MPQRARVRVAKGACAGLALAVLGLMAGLSGARADTPPYSLPVTLPPATATSPPVDSRAPYTPLVIDLIHQLEPSNPPTRAEIANASRLLHGGTSASVPGPFQNPTCHNVGPVSAPRGRTRASCRSAGPTRRASSTRPARCRQSAQRAP